MAVDLSRPVSAGFQAFGRAATFTPAGGAAQAITVVASRPDIESDLAQLGTKAPSTIVDIQVADVATVAAGDALTLGGQNFTVINPRRDDERLIWRCPLRLVS